MEILITDFQKFMYLYKQVLEYGQEIPNGDWGHKAFELHGIIATPPTDNGLGMLIKTKDFTLSANSFSSVKICTFYKGSKKELDKEVQRVKNMSDLDKCLKQVD